MSAIEQLFLEREAANRLREAHDLVDRERLANQAQLEGRFLPWAILALALIGVAFVVFPL